jgi:chromosome segregation ATPase
LLATVQQLQYRLGQAEARAELTEKAESTLREEREWLLADLERERERANHLEEELRQARRGWLRRFFGF